MLEALTEYCALYGEEAGARPSNRNTNALQGHLIGSIWGAECRQVREEDRLRDDVGARNVPVNRAWDLGMRDDTAIWFWQMQGGQIAILDYVASSGVALDYFRDEIDKRHIEHGWRHGVDYVPHDAKVKELGTGRTRVETMQRIGLNPMLVPLASLQDGLNAARQTLPLCVFHTRTELTGFASLEQYRREWNDDTKSYRASPLHDWTSHGCRCVPLPVAGLAADAAAARCFGAEAHRRAPGSFRR